jgi:hypothetical protein
MHENGKHSAPTEWTGENEMIVTSADKNVAKFDEFQLVQPDDDAGFDALAREVEAHGCHVGPRYAALMAAPLTAADLVGVPDFWRKIILRPIDPRLVAKAMRQARKYGRQSLAPPGRCHNAVLAAGYNLRRLSAGSSSSDFSSFVPS